MKNLISVIFVLFSFSTFAENGTSGHFLGSENLEISGCEGSRGISRSVNQWEATFTSNDSDGIVGKLNQRFGMITYTGQMTEEGKIKGTIRGLDNSGTRWMGYFNATVNGDDLAIDITGVLPSRGCRFISRINARRRHDPDNLPTVNETK